MNREGQGGVGILFLEFGLKCNISRRNNEFNVKPQVRPAEKFHLDRVVQIFAFQVTKRTFATPIS